ncbi:MAG: AAA family ATPase [Bacteroidales bacterium]|nr:AAA family ATPase [Bacteroidales bacterium]
MKKPMRFESQKIIGRLIEINNFFIVLKTRSIVLSSHRRMGKTMVLKKMTSEHPDEFIPVFLIVEGKSNPEEFIHDLFQQLKEAELIKDKSSRLLTWYEKNFAGKEIKDMKLPSFRPHWKEALKRIIEDLIEINRGKTVLIMIDEFPMMLYKFIKEYDLALQAIEMLDTLREIRQLYGDQGIKFIFCGSIGFNVVLNILRQEHNYAGAPINDMSLEILDAMTLDDAKSLAMYLVETKKVKIESNSEDLIELLCNQVDYLPFYIDLIIKEIEIQNEVINRSNIELVIEKLVSAPGNQGQFNHFSDRINTYYEDNVKDIALRILNFLAKKDEFIYENDIYNVIAAHKKIQPDDIKFILKKLFDDLYLNRDIRDGNRFYCFKYKLLKKWWSTNLS